MKDKLIKNYINNLKIKDIKDFALKNDILINDNEADYLFNIVKNKFKISLPFFILTSPFVFF